VIIEFRSGLDFPVNLIQEFLGLLGRDQLLPGLRAKALSFLQIRVPIADIVDRLPLRKC